MKPPSCPSSPNASSMNTQAAKLCTGQTFSRLPDEIVEDIFLEHILNGKDLYNVALVSRRFSRLVKAPLYGDVEISLQSKVSDSAGASAGNNLALVAGPENTEYLVMMHPWYVIGSEHVASPYVVVKEYTHFRRTLLEHPELACYVWSTKLSDGGYWDEGHEEALNRQAHELLELLPALRTLELLFSPCSELKIPGRDELSSIFNIPMPHLRYLSVHKDTSQSTISGVTKAITLPQIVRLSIDFVTNFGCFHIYGQDSHDTDLARSLNNNLIGTSSVETLTLVGCSEIVILESNLLKIPRNLKNLKCNIGRCWSILYPDRAINTLGLLCPNLVRLDLHFETKRKDISGSVADFSSFTSLKTLTVDDYLCFRTWPHDSLEERHGLYDRLPACLETLRIFFYQQFIFKSEYEEWAKLEDQLRDDCSWLLEAAEYKQTKFLGLEEVTLREGQEFSSTRFVEWVYPEDVLEAFETAGIHLFVTFMPIDTLLYMDSIYGLSM